MTNFVGILSAAALSATERPSNGVIAAVMIAVFIASAIVSAIVTHKLRKRKTKRTESGRNKNDAEHSSHDE